MITVKLSYSILHAWARGEWEQAVAMYLGKPFPPTPAMELGKTMHELFELYIDKHGKLPDELGGDDLAEPKTERKYQKFIPVSDDIRILLRGVIDLEDEPVIHEHKVGMTPATSYVDDLQLDYYKLLRPNAELGVIHAYNPYFKTYTRGIKYLSDANAEAALEHIISNGTELIDYLQTQKMLINYEVA